MKDNTSRDEVCSKRAKGEECLRADTNKGARGGRAGRNGAKVKKTSEERNMKNVEARNPRGRLRITNANIMMSCAAEVPIRVVIENMSACHLYIYGDDIHDCLQSSIRVTW